MQLLQYSRRSKEWEVVVDSITELHSVDEVGDGYYWKRRVETVCVVGICESLMNSGNRLFTLINTNEEETPLIHANER